MKKLTAKQQIFVNEYLIDLNATQAAIRAGYSKKTAQRIGSENLSKPLVAAAIQELADKRIERTQIDADWVLEQQVRVYEKCMTDIPVLDNEGKETGEYRFEHSGANKALENVGKHVKVNAFKGVDENDVPIDQNWTITIVHTDAKSHSSGKT